MRDTCTYPVFLDSRNNEDPVRGSKPTTSITTSGLSRAGIGVLRCIDLCSFGGIIFISSKLTFALRHKQMTLTRLQIFVFKFAISQVI